ncbi:uncharacterized protein AB675_3623 [Cyphellophora attinorum]|uniref:Uncharacterized protein n=1 Tax=Cyphellophora attinorum TaxID=1664694 RepID=A0A0N1HKA4_9EURO|nr:uncharacterized protein AB675_3623 [Phialophora attinorum]KPI37156.1 hypothetical protein AB675_3623 [Phialophora attinorum]
MAATNPAAAPTAPAAGPTAPFIPSWDFDEYMPSDIQALVRAASATPPIGHVAWLIGKRSVYKRQVDIAAGFPEDKWKKRSGTDQVGVLVEYNWDGEPWVLGVKPGQKSSTNPMEYGVWLGVDGQGNDVWQEDDNGEPVFDIMRIKAEEDPATMW